MEEFGVSDYVTKLTREFVKEQDILPHLSKKKFQKVGDDVIKKGCRILRGRCKQSTVPGGKKSVFL